MQFHDTTDRIGEVQQHLLHQRVIPVSLLEIQDLLIVELVHQILIGCIDYSPLFVQHINSIGLVYHQVQVSDDFRAGHFWVFLEKDRASLLKNLVVITHRVHQFQVAGQSLESVCVLASASFNGVLFHGACLLFGLSFVSGCKGIPHGDKTCQ